MTLQLSLLFPINQFILRSEQNTNNVTFKCNVLGTDIKTRDELLRGTREHQNEPKNQERAQYDHNIKPLQSDPPSKIN